MEVKCKECLFCGCCTGKSIKVERGFQVECTNCGARGPSGFSSKSASIIAWNVGDEGTFYRSRVECLAIKGALAESDGNIATAAELLNLSRDALKLRILKKGPELLKLSELSGARA